MEETPNVVKEELTTPQASEATTAHTSEGTTEAVPGSKTDSALLLEKLQVERERRRLAEEENRLLQEKLLTTDNQDYGDGDLKDIKSDVANIKEKLAKSEIESTHPVFKEKWSEFEDFRTSPENKGMNMKTAAKAFLIESGLIESPRKGLEKPSGGPKTPQPSGMTADDVKVLRTTNYKKYVEMLREGKIQITS